MAELSLLLITFAQDTRVPPRKFQQSPSVRQALVGNHMSSQVSKAAASDNANQVADVTWQFNSEVDLTKPTVWDRGMPEGIYELAEFHWWA